MTTMVDRARAWKHTRAMRIPGEPTARLGLAVFAVALFVFFSLRSSNFASSDNVLTIALTMSSIAIAVTGSMALLVSGNVDLSIGGIFGFVAASVGQVAISTQSATLAVGAGLLLGFALGTFNGVLVRMLAISPLIVTIGMLAVYRGLAYVMTEGVTIFGFPQSFLDVGRGGFGDFTIPIMVAIVVFCVGGFLLVRTKAGLRVYAIGGNPRAAALAGIRVDRTVIALFGLNGMLVGLVAVLATARLGSASPTLGLQFEFDVLTAAILGGIAFAGGAGRPMGVFIGVATIGILNAGLLFEGLEDYYQQIARGGLLVVALGADQLLVRRRRRARVTSSEAEVPDAEADRPIDDLVLPEARARSTGGTVLEAAGLGKHYGAVTALAGANLVVGAGEVVCLLGDNGAGKSTLIKILSGAERADEGTVTLNGSPVELESPRAARAAGIETVYQDLALCGNLSVAHNMVLGDEPVERVFGVLPVRDDQAAIDRARRRLSALSVLLPDQTALVDTLSGGQRQSVAIARAMHEGVDIAILDEPTAALGVAQTESVLELVRTIAARGTGVILITHDIETVLAVANRVVVLRLGTVVYDGPVEELDEVDLLQLMAGLRAKHSVPSPGEPATK